MKDSHSNALATQAGHTHIDSPFIAPQLSSLTKLVFTLPRGEQTDLLKESNQLVKEPSLSCYYYINSIMAALNFLRFLLLRDKKTDNKVTCSVLTMPSHSLWKPSSSYANTSGQLSVLFYGPLNPTRPCREWRIPHSNSTFSILNSLED